MQRRALRAVAIGGAAVATVLPIPLSAAAGLAAPVAGGVCARGIAAAIARARKGGRAAPAPADPALIRQELIAQIEALPDEDLISLRQALETSAAPES